MKLERSASFAAWILAGLVLAGWPGQAAGQEFSGRVGVVIPTEDRMGGGPYLGAAVAFPMRQPWLAVRISGGVGFTEHLTDVVPAGELTETSILGKRSEAQSLYDLDLSLVVGRVDGVVRPFLTAGVGYYRLAPGTDHEPVLYGAGWSAGLGTALRVGSVDVGVELGLRVFGGYLGGTSGERSFSPLTVSLAW